MPAAKFKDKIEQIPYRGFVVENIRDGRKVVITKPGGKFTFGTIKRDDFMVWIYNQLDKTLYLISHNNILEDLTEKGSRDAAAALKIITALGKVYSGSEPDEVLNKLALINPGGEDPEVLLKAYKWIWGQEDVNYPNGKGRAMSWEGLKKDEFGNWVETGRGILDLRDKLMMQLRQK